MPFPSMSWGRHWAEIQVPVIAALALLACGGREGEAPPVSAPVASYDTTALLTVRAEKDSSMLSPESPLPDDVRTGFRGLSYYPPNRTLAFRGRIQRFERPEPVRLMATGGETRPMLRYGIFRFKVADTVCSLTVYKSDAGESHLFLPFKDATNGAETYEVGRYLDLQEKPGPDDEYDIDFNLSYNPYCAYNDGYSCPIVPAENVLSVPIRAGERLPAWGTHGE